MVSGGSLHDFQMVDNKMDMTLELAYCRGLQQLCIVEA